MSITSFALPTLLSVFSTYFGMSKGGFRRAKGCPTCRMVAVDWDCPANKPADGRSAAIAASAPQTQIMKKVRQSCVPVDHFTELIILSLC